MGKGGGGGGTQTTRSEPWSGAKPHLRRIMDRARAQADFDRRYKPYGEQSFADFNEIQNAALQGQLDLSQGAMAGLANQLGGSASTLLNAADITNNPALNAQFEMLDRQAARQMGEVINPALEGGAMLAGQMGGDRQGIAQGVAARDLNEGLLNAKAGLMGDFYGKGLTAQAQAMGLAPGTMQAMTQPFQTAMGVGGAYQGMDQKAIDQAMGNYYFKQQEPYDRLSRYAGLVQGNAGLGGTSTMRSSGGTSPVAGAIGGGLAGASALSSLGPTLGLPATIGGMGLGPIGLMGGAILGGLFS